LTSSVDISTYTVPVDLGNINGTYVGMQIIADATLNADISISLSQSSDGVNFEPLADTTQTMVSGGDSIFVESYDVVLDNLYLVVDVLTATVGELNLFVSTKKKVEVTSITNVIDSGALDNRIIVTQSNVATTLGGVIDPTKEYFLDGLIDCSGLFTTITVPVGGIYITGYNFDISGIICSDDNFTLFTSGIGDSGNVLFYNFKIEVSGANSKVYDLTDVTGNNAIECNIVNYDNCTSLGDLYNYRQGLESGTGRFGGSPSLTLHGDWLGGFRITTSITRNMSDSTTAPLFCSGTAFVMQSRFLTDMNVDLGTLQPLTDFNDTNFPNPSTLELRDMILTRDGIFSPNDTNIAPNIASSNLSCSWKDNNGIPNTFVGGIATITTEVLTTISTVDVPVVLNGTVTTSDLQHFDSPSNGQLRHLGSNPREFTVNFDFVLDGGSNDDYKIELVKNDGSNTVVYQQTRVVNNLAGGRDVAYFTALANVIMNQNDYVFWQVTNLSDSSNCTLELDSSWSVEER